MEQESVEKRLGELVIEYWKDTGKIQQSCKELGIKPYVTPTIQEDLTRVAAAVSAENVQIALDTYNQAEEMKDFGDHRCFVKYYTTINILKDLADNPFEFDISRKRVMYKAISNIYEKIAGASPGFALMGKAPESEWVYALKEKQKIDQMIKEDRYESAPKFTFSYKTKQLPQEKQS